MAQFNLCFEDGKVFAGPFETMHQALYHTNRVASRDSRPPELHVGQLFVAIHWPADGVFLETTLYVREAK